MITEPGLYEVTAEEYHADPVAGGSLTSGGARKMRIPARYKWDLEHPQAPKAEYDIGHAVHRKVLGKGADLVEVDYPNYKKADAQALRDEAYAAGKTPLLQHQVAEVDEMASAVLHHPEVGPLFTPGTGRPELMAVWRDSATGVMCRAMFDWLTNPYAGLQLLAVDLKTTKSVDSESFRRSVGEYGYHQQADWYLTGIRALGLDDRPGFVFVGVEKVPPYFVAWYDLDADTLRVGARLNRESLERYRDCKESGLWPGPPRTIQTLRLKPWDLRRQTLETVGIA